MGIGSVGEEYLGTASRFRSSREHGGLREAIDFDGRCRVRQEEHRIATAGASGGVVGHSGLFRPELVSEIRKLIAQEAYGTGEQLSTAIDRMLTLV